MFTLPIAVTTQSTRFQRRVAILRSSHWAETFQPRRRGGGWAGNVFVADYGNGAVKEIPPGCVTYNCVKTICPFEYGIGGVAVDGSGNVFISTARRWTAMRQHGGQ